MSQHSPNSSLDDIRFFFVRHAPVIARVRSGRTNLSYLQEPPPYPAGYTPPVFEDLRVGVAVVGINGGGELLGVVHSLEGECEPEIHSIWEEVADLASLEQEEDDEPLPLLAAIEDIAVRQSFFRERSVVLVLIISDGDDGSPGSVERYHAALLAQRTNHEDDLRAAAIAGLPLDGSWVPGDPIEDMREQVSDPSCESEHVQASPPPRLTEFVYLFGVHGALVSICQAEWSPVLQVVTRRVGPGYTSGCFSREFPGSIEEHCRVALFRNDDCPCEEGREESGFDEVGRLGCELPYGNSWSIEFDSEECWNGARWIWDSESLPPGGTLRLECSGG